MGILHKLQVAFTIHVNLILLILPTISSSQEHMKTIGSHTSIKENKHKPSPKLQFEITLHGFLLWASMGFLMPIGILTIRMSKRQEFGRRLKIIFYAHAILQMLAVLLATAGAILSVKNFSNAFNNYHQRIGLALYGIIWLQVLVGFLRPQRGSKGRSVWILVHWLIGTAVSLLGVLNIYTGLQAYHDKTSRSIRLWTIIFTVQISSIVFFYLFQDKWVYIQKQGMTMCNEPPRISCQEIPADDKEKVLKAESC
ncbi:Cytochrome b561 domain-containing protein [Quillaja saponaria]|uniref:Cytochrome b561 domain-containing protein n=1 Tax=Quillaja saponaria TaxID=32244 RepID=A0AAD7LMG2_QUISA|nr:Cytochrome b561 domain-containing protein [Quillaja saponaria]